MKSSGNTDLIAAYLTHGNGWLVGENARSGLAESPLHSNPNPSEKQIIEEKDKEQHGFACVIKDHKQLKAGSGKTAISVYAQVERQTLCPICLNCFR